MTNIETCEIIISGIKARYLVKGKGQPLILIPGWKTDIERLMPFVNVFSRYFKFYTLDLPGTGGSGELKDYTMEAYAEFVSRWIKKLEIKDFILSAVSMGSEILLYAMLNEYVKKNTKGVLLIYPMYGASSLKLRNLTKTGLSIGSSILWKKPFCSIGDRIMHSRTLMKLIILLTEREKALRKGENLEYHASHFKRFSMRVSMQSISDALKFDYRGRRFMMSAALVISRTDPLIDFDVVYGNYKRIFPKLELISLPGKVHAERKNISQEDFEKNYGPTFRKIKRFF